MVWTTITNAQLAVGAPIRSVDLLALRDNITAAQNGDVGAPQQQTAGIADNAVTAAKVNKGNGIGTSGTQLVVACPAFNTVGSYAFGCLRLENQAGTISSGGNYAAGGGNLQLNVSAVTAGGPERQFGVLSGTWKWMGAAYGTNYNDAFNTGCVVCRVS